jgi:RecA-family ATPase
VLTGRSKDGKSLMAYDLTVAVASGGMALGKYAVTQGSVWYLALEDGERRAQTRLNHMQERLDTALSPEAQDKISLTLWEAPRLGEGLEEDLIAWIEATPDARLIVLDILEKVRPARKHNGNGYRLFR